MKSTVVITTIVMLISILAVKTSNAQDSAFKLSDYKNPNYFYQTLDLNFGLTSIFIQHQSETTDKSGGNNFSLYSKAGAFYSLYINSPGTQTELQTSFYGDLGSTVQHSKYESLNTEYNSNAFNHSENLNIEGLKRFYNAKQNYFEVSGLISGIDYSSSSEVTNKNSDTIISKYTSDHKTHNLNISGSFLIGKGRIEQVQDARMALYLLDDLQKLNRQNQIASNEDVLALAREITRLKYKRFFDDRLRKIAEITAIDSFLQKNGIAGTTDATYFTSLTDNWNYSNNPVRNSGKRFFTGIEADYMYSYNSQSSDNVVPDEIPINNIVKRQNAGAYIVAGVACEKPTSLKWQNSANLKIGVGLRQNTVHFDLDDVSENPLPQYTEALPSLKLTGNYGFGYYPTSRTWVTFDWWILSGWDKEMKGTSKQDKKDDQNSFYTYTGPQFHAYYYLSEKLRLSLTFTGEFRLDNDKFTYEVIEGNPDKNTSTWWNHQLNAALTYSLF
jgi:hypothetical protein